ncbi:RNA recognition motif domain-containing protein [Paraglaciecola arctica]|uniref:RNA recognition motif domain-containing protein n=1 Tax=Paraglaciecola arctica TaxID=1128911 RepID=UPI001C07570C|nr:RNA-binding protein [Paraglaciecola arctica]MBU3005150.1 RNA-binding protein [Paraglaciecola arctica]
MNPSFILNIFITAIIAIVMYVILPMIAPEMPNNLSAALGVLLGGLLVPGLVRLSTSTNSSGEQGDSSTVSTLYVGNLPYRADEEAVQAHFEQQGNVVSVRLMKDRRTGKRKGYGFVEMNAKGAAKAIKNLNDSTFQERTLKVRLAKEKVEDE